MQRLLTRIIDLIYENSCLICNNLSKNSLVCKDCENSFQERKQNYIKQFPEITVYSWGLYDGKLRQGILKLKSGKKKLANYFSKTLCDFWNKIPENIKDKEYLIISVPSHKKRIKERGYCQSSLIAKGFAERLNQNYSKNLVIRKKETLFMNSLANLNERKENIKDAFEVILDIQANMQERNILIIDDILTSGSTLCELARTIHKKSPDVNITGLTVASGDTYN